ncbi:MAG: sulfite exporter TauE/SafE family protein [Acidobacteria bacterium]|nr:MAG: sulfite exporter TauE/SafE family protein [Acidobacteriota bacterium]
MDEFMVALGAALWLGILTSISPCPLATNIAAISFLSRHIEKPWRTFVFGLLYTVGRILSYVAVGLIVMVSLVSVPSLSLGLQTWMNRLIGPLLVIIGLFLLNILKLNIPGLGFGPGGRIERLANRGGYLGSALLGAAFALSFCPVSAALFFGSLVPLALANQPGTAMFSIYGVGTAVPVLGFATLLAFASHWVTKAMAVTASVERWAKAITGVVFLMIGIYYIWMYTFSPATF